MQELEEAYLETDRVIVVVVLRTYLSTYLPLGTIHFETTMQELEEAYLEAQQGRPSSRPIIEMTLPSSLDKTISPPGKHVATLFVQVMNY